MLDFFTTGALRISGEGIWCSTDLKRKKLVHYCSQEKETGALLFLGEGIWCSTVVRRMKLVHFCSQGKRN